MQQRQLRLGDILDDYCPRERRITNHAVVAMVGEDVKQTRCTTCEAEHEFKHAKVPRQRRKQDSPAALYSQVVANGPKRVTHEHEDEADEARAAETPAPSDPPLAASGHDDMPIETPPVTGEPAAAPVEDVEEGPVHRPLIRATLPRPEGQPPASRPAPEFTIRQPGGRPNRFRPRHARGGQPQFGNRSNGNMPGGPMRGGMPRQGGGRPPHGMMSSRPPRRHGPKRQK